MGLWLVQECKRSLARCGYDYTYEELVKLAEAAAEGGPLVDAVDTRFMAPPDMPTEIRKACAEALAAHLATIQAHLSDAATKALPPPMRRQLKH